MSRSRVSAIARPVSACRRKAFGNVWRTGEAGYSKSVVKKHAETMKNPSSAASIRYSGQWPFTAEAAVKRSAALLWSTAVTVDVFLGIAAACRSCLSLMRHGIQEVARSDRRREKFLRKGIAVRGGNDEKILATEIRLQHPIVILFVLWDSVIGLDHLGH